MLYTTPEEIKYNFRQGVTGYIAHNPDACFTMTNRTFKHVHPARSFTPNDKLYLIRREDSSGTFLQDAFLFNTYQYSTTSSTHILNHLGSVIMPWTLNGIKCNINIFTQAPIRLPEHLETDYEYNTQSPDIVSITFINTKEHPSDSPTLYRELQELSTYDSKLTDLIRPTPRTKCSAHIINDHVYVYAYEVTPIIYYRSIALLDAVFDLSERCTRFPYSKNLYKLLYAADYDNFFKTLSTWWCNSCAVLDKTLEKDNLVNFFKTYRDDASTVLQKKELQYNTEIQKCLEQLVIAERELREVQKDLLYLDKQEDPCEEFSDYILNKVEVIGCAKNEARSTVYFKIRTPLTNYDEDLLTTTLANDGSYINRKKLAPLFSKLFLEGRYQMVTSAVFGWDLQNKRISALNSQDVGNALTTYAHKRIFINKEVAHPHLYYYRCLGSNRSHIERALNKDDYDIAIECCVAATKNINFADSTVVLSWVDRLISRNEWNEYPCVLDLEDPNNVLLTLHEAFPELYNNLFYVEDDNN